MSIISIMLMMQPMIAFTGNDDSDVKECGVEWVEDYSDHPGGPANLRNSEFNSKGFYDRLRNYAGWTGKFIWGDFAALEIDFETPQLGGHGLQVGRRCRLRMVHWAR